MVFVWYTKTEKLSNCVEMTIFVLQYNHNVRTIHSVLPCPSLAEVYFQIPEYRWQNGMGSTVPITQALSCVWIPSLWFFFWRVVCRKKRDLPFAPPEEKFELCHLRLTLASSVMTALSVVAQQAASNTTYTNISSPRLLSYPNYLCLYCQYCLRVLPIPLFFIILSFLTM